MAPGMRTSVMNQVDDLTGHENFEALIAVCGFQHLISDLAKGIGQHEPDEKLIFDDEYRLCTHLRSSSTIRTSGSDWTRTPSHCG